jgi:uncharacterized protein
VNSIPGGNLIRGPLSQTLNADNWTSLSNSVSTLVKTCMQNCDYYSVCGGGSPAHRWAEYGTLDGPFHTLTCNASVQAKMRGIVKAIATATAADRETNT